MISPIWIFFLDLLPHWLYNGITVPGKEGSDLTIKEAREKAGMSMDDLAKAVGVTPVSICRYEHGQRIPKTPIAKRIADVLGLVWYELIDDRKAG